MKKIKFRVFVIVVTALFSTVTSIAKPSKDIRTRHDFNELLRAPDSVCIVGESGHYKAVKTGNIYHIQDINISVDVSNNKMDVSIASPGEALKYVVLKWNAKFPLKGWKYLGDAWERGYGDLEWKALDPSREMPWYFFMSDNKITHGYGVMTGLATACSWKVSKTGVMLTIDTRNGGKGVLLGNRILQACSVVERKGIVGETSFDAAKAFCKKMCPNPRFPKTVVYGFNDWYCDYGYNSAEIIKYYTDYINRISPKDGARPFMVIDDGWQPGSNATGEGGPWDCGNDKFPSMKSLTSYMKSQGVRPGIWVRLLTAQHQPKAWRLSRDNKILDPSVPDVLDYVRKTVSGIKAWGFELIKHDYSTCDLLGKYGIAVAEPDADWSFSDRSRTTTEIIRDFYKAIREGAGDDVLVMGCQTVSHLSAGIFDISRIGDDTSGKDWGRVVKMGINSLAFRGPQHMTFYSADADCVGLASQNSIPWDLDKQWLSLVAKSGTPLFISFKKGLLNPEQEKDVMEALEVAAKNTIQAEPLDWMTNIQPAQWKMMRNIEIFNWNDGTKAK